MFKLIWQLCRSKVNPEDIPYSIPLLLGIICVNVSVLAFILILATAIVPVAILKAILLVAIIAIYSYALLSYYQVPERFVQVLSGLLASTSVLLVPFAVPYVIILFLLADTSSNSVYFIGLGVCMLLLFVLSCWLYLVYTRIYQAALEITLNMAMFYTLILFLISAIVFGLLPY